LKLHAAKDQEIPMGAIEDKIKAMGHTLPEPFKFPKPNRTGCVVVGSIVFVSGHGRYNGPTPGIKTVGKLGRDLTIEEGRCWRVGWGGLLGVGEEQRALQRVERDMSRQSTVSKATQSNRHG
jgi:hypothetical protein